MIKKTNKSLFFLLELILFCRNLESGVKLTFFFEFEDWQIGSFFLNEGRNRFDVLHEQLVEFAV